LHLIIFGGITGFNKSEIIETFTRKKLKQDGFSEEFEDEASKRRIFYVKFEDELMRVSGSTDIESFLGKPSFREKCLFMESAFTNIGRSIKEIEPDYVFLNIHLIYFYQSQFFPPFYKPNWKELDPNQEAQIKVITLVDDAFVIWKELKEREDIHPNTSLRLREILAWRSIEMLQAESVALEYTEYAPVNNYLVPVRHPFETFHNLVFQEEPKAIYLSFPITNTREHEECIKDINKFRKNMYELASEVGVVVFDPVTIDELSIRFADKEGSNLVLKEHNRWPLEIDSLAKEPDWPIIISEDEVQEAKEDIRNNIRPRDFKFIDNSILTAVYRKRYKGLSTGVTDEIRYANSRGKRVYVYDPPEDSESGEPHPFDPHEIGFRNLDEFYKDIKKGLEYLIN